MATEFKSSDPTVFRGKVIRFLAWERFLMVAGPVLVAAGIFWLAEVNKSRDVWDAAALSLKFAGMATLLTAIILDLRAFEKFPLFIAAELGGILALTCLFTMCTIVAWTMSQASNQKTSYESGMILFLYLPTLFISAIALRYVAKTIRGSGFRFLVLTAFFAITVVIEMRGQFRISYGEEAVMVHNSVLVAIAVGLWICAWGAKEFRKTQPAS